MTGTTTSERKVPTRRISFDESLQNLPKHFAADDDLIGSHLIAVLSAVFPDGEDFFVRSVRHYRDRITDPELKRQVAGFIGQEAIHGREHRVLNDRLDELGYPTKRIERLIKRSLGLRERLMSPRSNLAATAALEHFTATFAELILSDDDARSYIGEHAEGILMWHALEESEHKAVAFDVYKAVGGTERMRTVTMNLLTVGFLSVVVIETIRSLLGDKATFERGRLLRSWRRVRRSPFLDVKLWHHLRDYNRPDFHPDDFDSSELIARWRTDLFGEQGSLTDKLTSTATAAA
jgi:hypothetical protein